MNTEKTASEWFDMLIEPYCTRAKIASEKYPRDGYKKETYESLTKCLLLDFRWGEASEGFREGWDEIYAMIKHGNTTYLKPTEPAQPQFGEWVKVEDGLPQTNTKVIVKAKGYEVSLFAFTTQICGACDPTWICEAFNSVNIEGNEITHWMPLPPNPTN